MSSEREGALRALLWPHRDSCHRGAANPRVTIGAAGRVFGTSDRTRGHNARGVGNQVDLQRM